MLPARGDEAQQFIPRLVPARVPVMDAPVQDQGLNLGEGQVLRVSSHRPIEFRVVGEAIRKNPDRFEGTRPIDRRGEEAPAL